MLEELSPEPSPEEARGVWKARGFLFGFHGLLVLSTVDGHPISHRSEPLVSEIRFPKVNTNIQNGFKNMVQSGANWISSIHSRE